MSATVDMHGLFRSMNPRTDQLHNVTVALRWSSLYPEAVHVGIAPEDSITEVPWLVEREMLAAGINQGSSPGGDVTIRPCSAGHVHMVLGNHDLGVIDVELRLAFVAEFIERTVRHAPLGASSSIESASWWPKVAGAS